MDSKEKKELSEADIKAKFITPAIIKAGWDELTQVRREVTLTRGPVVVRGNLSSRNKKKRPSAKACSAMTPGAQRATR
jgi:type I restriction enzyme R subunit